MNISFAKLSPTHTKDWYVKWFSSILLIIAQALTSVGGLDPINLIFFWFGLLGWLIVGYWWNDRALIVVNAVALAIFANGLVAYFIKVG